MGVLLVANHPIHGERRFYLDREANVGSHASNHLVLTPPVDDYTARFLYRDGRIIVTDLRSVIGTFVNGRRIVQATIVRSENVVAFGEWVVRIDHEGRAEEPFSTGIEREQQLLAALAANPADDDLRQVYGDWLEENARPKEAEVLSLEREIRDGEGRIDPAELGRLGYRLRTLSAELPFAWRAAVTRPRIENCNLADRCPRTWDNLTQIGSVLLRHCRACEQNVHLAETIEVARHRVGQQQRVAVDVSLTRYPRDLEVALARLPAVAPPLEAGVTALPFFSHDEPPGTVGALLGSLHVPPPTSMSGGDMGFLSMPSYSDRTAEPPPPSPVIRFLSINYGWDMYHESRKTSFSEIEHAGYDRFGISFTADGDLVEKWLRTRFGAPREATQLIGGEAMVHRVYGNWLYYEGPGAGCSLSWERRLPDWAMAPTEKNVALRFLHEFSRLLSSVDCNHAAIEKFGSRPPPRSGIVVTGPLNRDDFWLALEPKLGALEIAHALGVEDPFGSSGDVHMSSWSIRDSKSRLGYPRYGNWVIQVHLEGWPSGTDVPGHYAAKHLAPKDLASTVCIRPFAL